MRVLSPTEKAFLEGSRQFTKAQQRYIRCRLNKKLRLINEESQIAAAALQRSSNTGYGNGLALVAQPGREKVVVFEKRDENSSDNNISPRRDLNARPKVYETFAEKRKRYSFRNPLLSPRTPAIL